MKQLNFNDAMQANLGFVTSQTSLIEPEVYRTRYPDVDYASLIPVQASGNEWIKSVTYFSTMRRVRANRASQPTLPRSTDHARGVEPASPTQTPVFVAVSKARTRITAPKAAEHCIRRLICVHSGH